MDVCCVLLGHVEAPDKKQRTAAVENGHGGSSENGDVRLKSEPVDLSNLFSGIWMDEEMEEDSEQDRPSLEGGDPKSLQGNLSVSLNSQRRNPLARKLRWCEWLMKVANWMTSRDI